MENHEGLRENPAQRNRGDLIDEANIYVGVDLGSPWCASIISLSYKKNNVSLPRDGRASALFPPNKLVYMPWIKPGDLGGIYYPGMGRIGHVFMVRKVFGHFILTVEGNTNMNGSRNGDGLFKYIRPVSTVRYYSRWPYTQKSTFSNKFKNVR